MLNPWLICCLLLTCEFPVVTALLMVDNSWFKIVIGGKLVIDNGKSHDINDCARHSYAPLISAC